jgi:TRAP-type C4-dicarboxylate transport system substrate-binding protein
MNKETWESLSPEGKATWDKMDTNDKWLVLQYAKQRADKATTSINTHETSVPKDTAGSDPEVVSEVSAAEVHNAVTKA